MDSDGLMFLASYTLSHSPIGKGKKHFNSMGKFGEALNGNWQMKGIWTFRPWGQPYSLGGNCTGIWASCRLDLLPGKNPQNKPDGGRRPDKWFATDTVALAAAGTYGNLGGNTMYAPPTRTLEFSLA